MADRRLFFVSGFYFMDLSNFVVLSTDGSYFGANTAFLVDTRKLSEAEIELLNDGSDTDRYELAIAHGHDLELILDEVNLD